MTTMNTGAASLSDETILAIEKQVAYLAKSRNDLTIKTVRECIDAAIAAGGAQEAVQVGSETWNVLRLCITELSSWMHDHGQDLRSQEAIKRARALLAASNGEKA
jgi:hypothetical protein